MELSQILTYVDHTLLKPEATLGDIKAICDDAMRFNTASVCIPPSYVKACADYCGGKMKICTVIGFPNGYNTTAVKVFETEREDGGFYRMLTFDDVFQKYKSLKQFQVKDIWDKYVSISEWLVEN